MPVRCGGVCLCPVVGRGLLHLGNPPLLLCVPVRCGGVCLCPVVGRGLLHLGKPPLLCEVLLWFLLSNCPIAGNGKCINDRYVIF